MTHLILSNKILIQQPPEILKDILIEELTMDNPAFFEAQKRGYSTYNIKRVISDYSIMPDDSIKIPRGYKESLFNHLKNLEIKYSLENKLTFNNTPADILGLANIDLRPYQRKYLYKLLLTGRTEGLIVAPPGSGKTIFAIALASVLGQSTLWLTHRKLLINQSKARFLHSIINLRPEDIGMIHKGKWNINPIFTIASLDTMRGNKPQIRKIAKQFGLVILDECHHVAADTFKKVISELHPHYLYGLTATPYRGDGLDPLMFHALGEPIVTIPQQEVVDDGGIIMPVVYYKAIETKEIEGNNIHAILKTLINNDRRNNIIVGDVLAEAIKGKMNIVISNRKEHCELLFKLISIGWERTGIITGDYNEKHCDEQIRRLERKEITTLIATGEKFGEGVDIDILENAFLALPFRSEQDVEQIIGRIQRSEKNKKEVKVFDYVDHRIGVVRDQFCTPTKNKECRLNAYKRLGLQIKPIE